MFCLDWNDDTPFELVGEKVADDDYARLEVIFVPCNYLHTQLGYDGDSVHPECVGSKEEQIAHMGQSNLVVYLNQERINPIGYGDEIIERYSEIKNTQFDEFKPGWIKSRIHLKEFQDESDYF